MHVFTAEDPIEQQNTPRSGSKKPLLIFAGLVLFLIAIFLGLPLLLEPTSPPKEVFISNVTERQATVSWITAKPTKGAVKINGKTILDDGDKDKNSQGFYATHHVTIPDLSANQNYKFEIYQGWKKVYKGTFVTVGTLETINTPEPIYGKIVDSTNKPQVGVIVYFTGKTEGRQSALYSTLTNNDGNWQLDLANIRSLGLKTSFTFSKNSVQDVVVQTGIKGKFTAATDMNNDQPWPDIIIK